MRYFVRAKLINGGVDELFSWNGRYGFSSREFAEADIDEFIEETDEAYEYGMLDEPYNREDFFVEEVDIDLPLQEAD